MITKVNHENLEEMLHYVKQEPSINLFIIGDVEQYGIDVDFQEVYLQYTENHITACVLRYYTNVIIYSHIDDFNVTEIRELLSTMNVERINGKKSVLDQLIPHLSHVKKIEECYFCELNNGNQLLDVTVEVKEAIVEDLPRLYEILKLVNFHSNNFIEANTRKIQTKAGRFYFIEQEDHIISTASTSIETSVSAMIGGVTTHVDYRTQGKASQVVSKLCNDLLKENKKPCLFYHNPKAGSIYHRLGFIDIDRWTMVTMA